AWFNTKVNIQSFKATFKYQMTGNMSGMTFALQNANNPLIVLGGIRDNGLGYATGTGQQGPNITPSAALGWVTQNGINNNVNTIVAGVNGLFVGSYTSIAAGGLDFTQQHVIDFTITGAASSNQLNVTMVDETTLAQYVGSVTLPSTLASVVGGTVATMGL